MAAVTLGAHSLSFGYDEMEGGLDEMEGLGEKEDERQGVRHNHPSSARLVRVPHAQVEHLDSSCGRPCLC